MSIDVKNGSAGGAAYELMLGNEAVARAAYEAGVSVATAYPGTPSTEITENIAKYDEIYCEWSPNEKVALEVAIGSSFAGARAMCSMKHVGLNVASDPLYTASYTGVGEGGGLVVMVADDPGMHSSQNEQDTRVIGYAAKIPVLEPADSQECLDYVKEAFRISEEYDTPVIVRLTTRVAHSRSPVRVGERESRAPKGFVRNVGKYVMMPAMARARHVVVEARMRKLEALAETTWLNRFCDIGGGSGKPLGVIAAGAPFQYAMEALEGDGGSGAGVGGGVGASVGGGVGGARILKLGMVNPPPRGLIAKLAKDGSRVLIAEELFPFFEDFARGVIGDGVSRVVGKALLPSVGELSAGALRGALASLRASAEPAPAGGAAPTPPAPTAATPAAPAVASESAPLPARPPVLCPGCPHRGVFYVLRKMKLTVCGDIGCYTLGSMPPLEAVDTCVCMGASIGVAHGMDKALGRESVRRTVAVIGDSTFLHSGTSSLMNVAYNRGVTTTLILDNSITGMTGHQQNPATGRTIRGEPTFKTDLVDLCRALGVANPRVADAFEVEALEAVIREELAKDQPSAIIVRRPCALLKEFKPELASVSISEDKCVRCGRCMGISCAAISAGEKSMRINEALCVRCGLCARMCKVGAIEATPVDAGERSGL